DSEIIDQCLTQRQVAARISLPKQACGGAAQTFACNSRPRGHRELVERGLVRAKGNARLRKLEPGELRWEPDGRRLQLSAVAAAMRQFADPCAESLAPREES